MENQSIIGIDLGSAYTKVAIRAGWDERAELMSDLPIATKEISFCIPSVVARVRRGNKDEWLIGVHAANVRNGDRVTIYRNWKAGLLGEDQDDMCEVAVQFFNGLRATMKHEGWDADDLAGFPVRVTVPKWCEQGEAEETIRDILKHTGWIAASGRATVFEPEANTLGILSTGRNQTWIPKPMDFKRFRGREPVLPRMLDEAFNKAFRHMRDCYEVLVTDIGAFTTDFGYVKFDPSFKTDDWNKPVIRQCSYQTGVRELDQAVYDRVGERAKESISRLTSAEWDRLKAKLYAGEEIALQDRAGRMLKLGRGVDAEIISDSIRGLVRRVIAKRCAFCKEHGLTAFDAEILTGGGAAIPEVRRAVLERMTRDGTELIHELRDRPDLLRGGSALGAVSVFFE